MSQTIAIDDNQVEFLNGFSRYGFKNQKELVAEALERLRREFEHQSLEESADLYAELYAEDEDLAELTESALAELVHD